MITKETELIHAIIVYCQRCREEGDYTALSQMRFGPLETNAIAKLSSADKLHMSSMRSHFMDIKLNTKTFWRTIDYIQREQERDAFISDLIAADAPLPMIHSLTGMGGKQYTFKRRELGLGKAPSGRPKLPGKRESDAVWKKLKTVVEKSSEFGPKEFAALYESLDKKISLRTIWHLFYQWEESGKLKVHRSNRV